MFSDDLSSLNIVIPHHEKDSGMKKHSEDSGSNTFADIVFKIRQSHKNLLNLVNSNEYKLNNA